MTDKCPPLCLRPSAASLALVLSLIGAGACAQTPGMSQTPGLSQTPGVSGTPGAPAPAAAATTEPGQTAPAATDCPLTAIPFRLDVAHVDGYRVFVGPDGDSAVEPLRIDARSFTIPSNGKSINIFDFPKSVQRNVQVVAGPAHMELAPHPTAYPEMFILLSGSFTFRTKTFSAEMQPGSVLLFEDMGATTGHGGTIGPCGYVSLSIAP